MWVSDGDVCKAKAPTEPAGKTRGLLVQVQQPVQYQRAKESSKNNLHFQARLICPVCRYNTLKYAGIPEILNTEYIILRLNCTTYFLTIPYFQCVMQNSGKIGKTGKTGVGLQTSLLYIYYNTSIYVEYKNKKLCRTPPKIPDYPKNPDF